MSLPLFTFAIAAGFTLGFAVAWAIIAVRFARRAREYQSSIAIAHRLNGGQRTDALKGGGAA